MIKKTLIAISLFLIISIGTYLCFFMSYQRIITAHYTNLGIEVIGSSIGPRPVSFDTIRISPSWPALVSPAVAKDFAIVINHRPHFLNSLTTTALVSLGLSLQKFEDSVQLNNPAFSVKLRFIGKDLKYCLISSEKAESHFIYRGSSPCKLPISRQKMESIFGKPDSIESDELILFARDILFLIRKLFSAILRLG